MLRHKVVAVDAERASMVAALLAVVAFLMMPMSTGSPTCLVAGFLGLLNVWTAFTLSAASVRVRRRSW